MDLTNLLTIKGVRDLDATALENARVKVLDAIKAEMAEHGDLVDENLIKALANIYMVMGSRNNWDAKTTEMETKKALMSVAPKGKDGSVEFVDRVLGNAQIVLGHVEDVIDFALGTVGHVAGWGLKRVFSLVDGIKKEFDNKK